MAILIKPIITEKMTAISEKMNRYGFIVDKKSKKNEIKKAIEKLYDVKVKSVNTMIYSGKSKSRNVKAGAITGKTKSVKKAIVTLMKDETIDFYSNI
jgi:large subunit ribosomal protein L23